MKKRILMIVIAAAAMLAGASAPRQSAISSGMIPWCPPFCPR